MALHWNELNFNDDGNNILSEWIQKIGLKRNWISQLSRMSNVMIDQQRALRKRELIKNYKNKVYEGTYWATTTNISDYTVDNKLASDNNITKNIAKIPTRLKAFSVEDQAHLINWGYALSDAAIRCFVDPSLQASQALPIPEYTLK